MLHAIPFHFVLFLRAASHLHLLIVACRYDFNDVDDGSVSADFANAEE
jgi:hypothetical protein